MRRYPAVDGLGERADSGELAYPAERGEAQGPGQRRANGGRASEPTSTGFDSPRRLLALRPRQADRLRQPRLLARNDLNAIAAIQQLNPMDAPGAEAAGAVEDQQ